MRKLYLPPLILAAAVLWFPAHAASTIFGDSGAQECYESARFHMGSGGLAACDRALKNPALSRRDRAATLVNRGILLNRENRAAEAIDDFNAALRISGRLGEAYLNRGNSNFFRKRIKSALADYTRAIQHNSRQLHVAYFNRGLTYEVLSRFDDARRDYEKALELKPNFTAARERLSALPNGKRKPKPFPAAAG